MHDTQTACSHTNTVFSEGFQVCTTCGTCITRHLATADLDNSQRSVDYKMSPMNAYMNKNSPTLPNDLHRTEIQKIVGHPVSVKYLNHYNGLSRLSMGSYKQYVGIIQDYSQNLKLGLDIPQINFLACKLGSYRKSHHKRTPILQTICTYAILNGNITLEYVNETLHIALLHKTCMKLAHQFPRLLIAYNKRLMKARMSEGLTNLRKFLTKAQIKGAIRKQHVLRRKTARIYPLFTCTFCHLSYSRYMHYIRRYKKLVGDTRALTTHRDYYHEIKKLAPTQQPIKPTAFV